MEEKAKSIRQQALEAMRAGNLYDFIANNYHLMSKEDLASIIKDMDFVIYCSAGEEKRVEFEKTVAENLVQTYDGWAEEDGERGPLCFSDASLQELMTELTDIVRENGIAQEEE